MCESNTKVKKIDLLSIDAFLYVFDVLRMSFCSFYPLGLHLHHLSLVLSPRREALGREEAHTELCSLANTAIHWESICNTQHLD